MTVAAEIDRAAKELVDRYGKEAVGFARQWAENLARNGMVREESVALRVMTAAERLLDERLPRRPRLFSPLVSPLASVAGTTFGSGRASSQSG